jgi:steroid delta-isomerase-like uncharacterized protein
MLERNKEIIRTLAEDVIARGDLERVADIFAPTYAPHDPSNPSRRGGVEGAREFIAMLHAGMSDVRYSIEDLTAEGDRVVYRWTLQGTHTGVFMGVPPSGRTIRVTGMDMFRLVNGKIVESWASADALGMLQQLGVLPAPGPPPGASAGPTSGAPLVSPPSSSGRSSARAPHSGSPQSGSPVSAVPPTMRS